MEAKPTDLSLSELQALGFFRASRKYRHAVRINRADWLRVLLNQGGYHRDTTVVDLVARHGLDNLASQYRISHAAESVELPASRMAEFLQLEHNSFAGYVYNPAPGDPEPEPMTERDYEHARQLVVALWGNNNLRVVPA
jgi:hypothetical protein